MFPPETEIVILWYKGSGGKGRNGNFPPEIFGCQKTVKKSNSCKKIPPNSAEFGAKNLFFGNLGTKWALIISSARNSQLSVRIVSKICSVSQKIANSAYFL